MLVASLTIAPGARAGTIRVINEVYEDEPGEYDTSTDVVYRAAPGEANRLTVALAGKRMTVTDRAGVVPGRGCRRPDRRDRTTASCLIRYELEQARFFLGDRADVARISRTASGLDAEVRGGRGNDVLTGPALFTGGPGNDWMRGLSFNEGTAKNGSDTMIGIGRRGVVYYSGRRRPVWADLDGRRDDGERGERDRIVGAYGLSGGRAADHLTGNRYANTLYGNGGDDRLVGRGGADDLLGGDGADTIFGGRGNDSLHGDSEYSGRGADRLFPGPGVDAVRGDRGDDTIPASDGAFDFVNAGPGCNHASLDADDWYQDIEEEYPLVVDNPPGVAAAGAAGCGAQRAGVPGLMFMPDERLSYFASDRPGVLEVGARLFNDYLPRGFVYIDTGCPGDAPSDCQGSATLVADGRQVGSASLSVPRNRVQWCRCLHVDDSFFAAHRVGDRVAGTLVISFQDPDGHSVERQAAVTVVFTD